MWLWRLPACLAFCVRPALVREGSRSVPLEPPLSSSRSTLQLLAPPCETLCARTRTREYAAMAGPAAIEQAVGGGAALRVRLPAYEGGLCVWLCPHVALVTSFARECAPARSCLLQAFGVAVSGTYAYVVGVNSDSLAVVDVSTPSSPTLAGSLIDSTNMDGVSCFAHHVVVAVACLPCILRAPCVGA